MKHWLPSFPYVARPLRSLKFVQAFTVPLLAVALLTGCATKGYQKADSAASSLQKAAISIDAGRAQLDATLAALSDLVNNPGADLKPQFKKFTTELSGLEKHAAAVNRRTLAMQKSGDAYFVQWDAELAKIQSEDIRNRSTERRQDVANKFSKAKASYEQVNTDFAPLLSNLRDIRTALSADLTPGGLSAISRVVNDANEDAIPLRASLDRLSANFRELGVSLSASAPPPEK